MDKDYHVFYRVLVHGHITDWHRLAMESPYDKSIQGPDIVTVIHWRTREISQAVSKIENDICKVVELKVVEVPLKSAGVNLHEL